MIKGTVKSRSTDSRIYSMPGVQISNGREVVRSDEHGRYTLPQRSEDRFAFITVPSGYASSGPFHRKLSNAEEYDFELVADLARSETEFSFVHITDIHISTGGEQPDADDLRQDLYTVLSEVGCEARFIVATGDLTERGAKAEFDSFLEAIEDFPLPIYTCIGNHDDGDPVALGDHYNDALGPTYYSFDYGPVHFVAYDGVRHTWPGDSDHQESWVRADLDALDPGTPTVMLIHYPWGDWFYDRFKNDQIIASFSGHWHCTRIFGDYQTTHYNTPTFCFGGIDQSPPAYRFCTYRDGAVSSEIRTLDASYFRGTSFRPRTTADPEVLVQTADRPQPDADWPLFRRTPTRAGSVVDGPSPPFTLAWKAATGGGLLQGSPILKGESLFIGTQNEDRLNASGLLAMNASDGDVKWHHQTEYSIKLSPAGGEDRVFAVTVAGEVFALSERDGRPLWTYHLGDPAERWVYSSPLAWEGRLFTGVPSCFVALDQDSGDVIWKREDLGTRGIRAGLDWIASYPSPAAFEEVIVIAFHGELMNLAVLEATTGKTIWLNQEEKTHRMSTSPVIAPDGTIFVVSGRSCVRAFDIRTREVSWETPLEKNRCGASPALSRSRLFVPSGDGTITALDPSDGAILWEWESQEGLGSFTPYVRGGKGAVSSPVVSDRHLFLGSADGHLYALDVDSGDTVWSHDLGIPSLSSPLLSGDGLWTGTCDGTIHALRAIFTD